MTLTVGECFAGVGGLGLGAERAGCQIAWQIEKNPRCQAVLRHHWPNVTRYGDIREVRADELSAVDVICGGFPCQDLSLAGNRAGLAGSRSGLWFEFYRIIKDLTPKWVVVENVSDLLSSNRGRDFAVILRGLAQCGYGVAWRVLDAQYFGVPQRRRRVFIVGHLGDGRAAKVLFDPDCVSGHPPPQRGAETRITGTLTAGPRRGGVTGQDINSGLCAIVPSVEVSPTLRAEGADGSEDGRGRHAFVIETSLSVSPALRAEAGFRGKDGTDRAYAITTGTGRRLSAEDTYIVVDAIYHENKSGNLAAADHARALRAGASHSYQFVSTDERVRRLTPRECERLQGFSDDFTASGVFEKKRHVVTRPISDTARYHMMGNAVCVPVSEWLFKRLVEAS